LIYQAKPQRGGRSISANTNNPPQDPPAPPTEIPEIIPVIPEIIPVIPEIIPVEVPVIDVVEIPEIIPLIKIKSMPKVTLNVTPNVTLNVTPNVTPEIPVVDTVVETPIETPIDQLQNQNLCSKEFSQNFSFGGETNWSDITLHTHLQVITKPTQIILHKLTTKALLLARTRWNSTLQLCRCYTTTPMRKWSTTINRV